MAKEAAHHLKKKKCSLLLCHLYPLPLTLVHHSPAAHQIHTRHAQQRTTVNVQSCSLGSTASAQFDGLAVFPFFSIHAYISDGSYYCDAVSCGCGRANGGRVRGKPYNKVGVHQAKLGSDARWVVRNLLPRNPLCLFVSVWEREASVGSMMIMRCRNRAFEREPLFSPCRFAQSLLCAQRRSICDTWAALTAVS